MYMLSDYEHILPHNFASLLPRKNAFRGQVGTPLRKSRMGTSSSRPQMVAEDVVQCAIQMHGISIRYINYDVSFLHITKLRQEDYI